VSAVALLASAFAAFLASTVSAEQRTALLAGALSAFLASATFLVSAVTLLAGTVTLLACAFTALLASTFATFLASAFAAAHEGVAAAAATSGEALLASTLATFLASATLLVNAVTLLASMSLLVGTVTFLASTLATVLLARAFLTSAFLGGAFLDATAVHDAIEQVERTGLADEAEDAQSQSRQNNSSLHQEGSLIRETQKTEYNFHCRRSPAPLRFASGGSELSSGSSATANLLIS